MPDGLIRAARGLAARLRIRRGRPRVDARFRDRLRLVLADLEEAGYTVIVNSLYRSHADQEELIARWEEGDQSIITEPAPPGASAHNFGMAADIELDPPDYDVLGEVAESRGLVQPDPEGDWVHIELRNWRAARRGWNERRLVAL